jgi:hypothetical protein
MGKFIHFKHIYLDKLDKELFGTYMDRENTLLEELGAKELGVEAYAEDFKMQVGLYMDIIGVSRRFVQTGDLNALDKERSQAMVFIQSVIRNKLKSGIPEAKKAAVALMIVAKDLGKNSYSNRRTKKTGLIDAYLFDFEKEENVPLLERLNLTADIASLKALNERYKELDSERSSARKELRDQPKVGESRRLIGALYEDITDTIMAMHVLHNSEAARQFIAHTNTRIREITTTYKQSQGQKKRWKNWKEEKSEEKEEEQE